MCRCETHLFTAATKAGEKPMSYNTHLKQTNDMFKKVDFKSGKSKTHQGRKSAARNLENDG